MDTYTDASYNLALGQSSPRKPYMMPVSPWFFTNLPGYNKNWLWNGNDLWYDRWTQVLSLDPQPEFLQIISWNDYGESHYIGPLDDRQYEAFDYGKAPYNYVKDMPHDGWRKQLPWLIDLYKKGSTSSSEENLVVSYRRTLSNTCGTGNTTMNTATQLQYEFSPAQSFEDKIQITALLNNARGGDRKIEITTKHHSGIKPLTVTKWDYTPQGGVGLHHVSLSLSDSLALFTHKSGFKITISPLSGPRHPRHSNGSSSLHLSLPAVLTSCKNPANNWNAYVASTSSHVKSFSPAYSPSTQKCIRGWGANEFDAVCQVTCKYGYCPTGACVCSAMGAEPARPTDGGNPVDGFPANGDANYGGLCSFACGLGEKYCDSLSQYCSRTQQPPYIPPTSPFQPPFCRGGRGKNGGSGVYGEVCEYTCKHGFCPIAVCECTETGGFPDQPAWVGGGGYGIVPGAEKQDHGVCDYACNRGYCPETSCTEGYP